MAPKAPATTVTAAVASATVATQPPANAARRRRDRRRHRVGAGTTDHRPAPGCGAARRGQRPPVLVMTDQEGGQVRRISDC
jgi:hypothetical protein